MRRKCSVLVCVLLVMSLFVSNIVADSNAVEASYDLLVKYYESKEELVSCDEVLAVEALGLESEDFKIAPLYDKSSDFKDLYESELSKLIIALVLCGEDPHDVNDVDLVSLLESYVHKDGRIGKEDVVEANAHVWCLNALYIVASSKVELIADALVKQQRSDGSFSWAGQSDDIYANDPDTSAWCMETLYLIDAEKYDEVLKRLKNYYLESNVKSSDMPYWDNFGMNANTQASVLSALANADRDALDKGLYDAKFTPYDTLLSFQNEAGYFGFIDNKEYSDLATNQVALALGSYKHGSILLKAKATYEDSQTTSHMIWYGLGGVAFLIVLMVWVVVRRKHEKA